MPEPDKFEPINEDKFPAGEGWLGLGEATPAEGESVFVFSPNGIPKAAATYRGSKFYDDDGKVIDQVTHWMGRSK